MNASPSQPSTPAPYQPTPRPPQQKNKDNNKDVRGKKVEEKKKN
uniref:Uncharacterized protein n=1 Tax=Meloidogyne enterolobii TaxID=390850 RepID=A0A6V7WCE0_MELEN|nr:unnamed protein product [Meloidogyne enterolobii]